MLCGFIGLSLTPIRRWELELKKLKLFEAWGGVGQVEAACQLARVQWARKGLALGTGSSLGSMEACCTLSTAPAKCCCGRASAPLSQVLGLHVIVWVFHVVCISAVHWKCLEMSPFVLGLSPMVCHLDLGLPWVKMEHLQVALTQRPNYLVELDLKHTKSTNQYGDCS